MFPLLDRVRLHVEAVDALRRAGMLNPQVALRTAKSLRTWGPTLAAGYLASAERRPDATAVIDDEGAMTFAELDHRSDQLADVLRTHGIEAKTPVGLLARNSRWFVLSVVALDKLGATVLYMNTGFAGPQLADVMHREGCGLLLHDAEFSEAVATHAPDLTALVTDGNDPADLPALVQASMAGRQSPPDAHGRQVILTSGTTGVPKGAARSLDHIPDLVTTTSLLQRVPFHVGDVHVVPAPMFHSLGNAALLMGAQMSHTLVMTRRFDPAKVLRLIADHDVRVMTAVPVMLQRMVALDEAETADVDVSALDVVFCSGSALPGSLALTWMDRFGDNLYNMYGSTEVAAATIATPADLRAAPGTAGRPLNGVDVRLYDDHDQVVTDAGVDGRIFVGSGLRFDGYTNGQTKAAIDGLLSSGDLGHWDDDGRLFVGGRDDDMIVSGGENLYPREVEDLLADHPSIHEAAVIGVDDAEFGKRLVAFVVLEAGKKLSEEEVKAHVKANLANYKVPRSVTFLDELPRNATGKVLKRELNELA